MTISFKSYFHNNKSLKGFTLIELLISLALFTSVITIATGALFSAQAINTQLEQKQIVLDGVNLVMDTIAREIRYGSVFYCSNSESISSISIPTQRQDCPLGNQSGQSGGGQILIFKPSIQLEGSDNYDNDRVAYYMKNGIIYKDEYPSGGTPRTNIMITTPDVNVSKLFFFVSGTPGMSSSDFNQPVVTIAISGNTITSKKNISSEFFNLQTSVSSRRLDN